ncbi:MAG: hypothetical protein ACYSRQ_05175, partial [Planctomycetota bacterium]
LEYSLKIEPIVRYRTPAGSHFSVISVLSVAIVTLFLFSNIFNYFQQLFDNFKHFITLYFPSFPESLTISTT